MKKYLVVEDHGDRTKEFYKALDILRQRGVDVTLDHEYRVDHLIDRGYYPVEQLASYDAFFIDFDLSSKLDPSDDSLDFSVQIGDETMKVHATTGMGVLLYLTRIIQTDKYRSARDQHAKKFPGDNVRPRFYTFVELDNFQSKFYAAAARSWFGADFFRAVADSYTLASMLEDLDDWRDGWQPELVRNAVTPFNFLMDCKLASTHYDWGSMPEAYEWLNSYLHARGKTGGQMPFISAVHRHWGIQVAQGNATNQLTDYLNPIQEALKAVIEVYEEGCTDAWPERLKVRDNQDPMFEVLLESRLFWEEPDVRTALRAHRARQRLPRGLG